MNRICSACNVSKDKKNCLKDRTVCKSCYNKHRRKSNNTIIENEVRTSHQQPKFNEINNNNVSAYEKHRHVIIGPSNVDKKCYLLKILEKIGNKRPIHIITRSPNQYPNYKTRNEIKPIDKNKGSVVVFDDMLEARNSSQMDELFIRDRHENLDVYILVRAVLVCPDKALERTVIEHFFLNKHQEMLKVCIEI